MSKRVHVAVIAAALMIAGASAAFAVDETITPDNAANPDFTSVKALVDSGKFDEAMPQLQALDKQSPNNPDLLNLIGFTYRKTGHTDKTLEYYIRALNLEPKHLGANGGRGGRGRGRGRPGGAGGRRAGRGAAGGN